MPEGLFENYHNRVVMIDSGGLKPFSVADNAEESLGSVLDNLTRGTRISFEYRHGEDRIFGRASLGNWIQSVVKSAVK